jgi:hypothetical protein
MGKNNTVSKLEFSKWIVASSCDQALTQARSFWDSQEILSSSSGAICFQHILTDGKNPSPADIEWLVQSKIECREDCESCVLNDALNKDWGREDIFNNIITSSTEGPKDM